MTQTSLDYSAIHAFELDDHLVVLRDGADRVQIFNPLAKYIWDSLKNELAAEHIAEEIAQSFAISPVLALRDVTTVIKQWSRELSDSSLNAQPVTKSIPSQSIPENWMAVTETTFRFSYFSVRVRFARQEVADWLRPMLTHLICSRMGETDHTLDLIAQTNKHFIIIDDEMRAMASSAKEAAVLAFGEMIELACRRENWLTILHAAGVAWQGSGIIFPALGGSGKSTLTAGLIQAGFKYINDDVIPVERDRGGLVAIPASLCIKSGSWSALKYLYPSLSQSEVFSRNRLMVKYLAPPANSISSLASTYSAKYLIASQYQKNMSTRLQAISAAEGLQAIIEAESLLRLPLQPQDIKALVAWVKPLQCYRLSYGELAPAVEAIGQLVN